MSGRNASFWWASGIFRVIGSGTLAVLLVTGANAVAGPHDPTTHVQVATATAPSVTIEEFKFMPATVTVPVGTTVTWVNRDEESHTVTSATGAFGSAGLSHAETFARTFTRPGTYQYFCALHPHMKATVVVK